MELTDPKEKPKVNYEMLWKFIIRPPRDTYEEDWLGDNIINYRDKIYVRKDYDIINDQGYILKGSFIEPEEDSRPSPEMPVVIYLHGNSSSRLEGLKMLENLLSIDINLFVFDFAGSGLSEGEYISLGYHESNDLKAVIDFLENLPGVGKIGLWGRSMGAATAMIYAHRDERVSCICMDSPFADFDRLARELCLKQVKLPNFVISAALSIVKGTIKKKNGLDISKLRPIDSAPKTGIPAIFIHALKDELININHSIELSEQYNGPKSLNSCKGGHNSIRPKQIIKRILKFFNENLNGESDENKKGEPREFGNGYLIEEEEEYEEEEEEGEN